MKLTLLATARRLRLALCLACLICCTTLNATNVSGNQSGTWTKANSPYIISGTVTVPAGKKLIIEPGVEIRSLRYDDKFEVDGVLYAVGTTVDSIRFNGFANAGVSSASTHGGFLYLNSTNNSDSTVLAFVSMNKWGDKDYYTGDQAAIELAKGIFIMRNSTISNSELQGIWGYGEMTKLPTITGVVFVNNPVPVHMYTDNVGNISNCTGAVINLQGGTFSRASTIPKPGNSSYYILDKGSAHYFENVKLTIKPGVEIRSMNYADKLVMEGTSVLSAIGSASDSIRFKGFADAATDPLSTHGGLIQINSTNATDSTVMSYISMDKMGDKDYYTGDQAAIELEAGIFVMRNSRIANSELQGIWGYGDLLKNPVIANVTFVNNPVPVRVYTDNAGGISNCTGAVINLQGGTFSHASTISKPGTNSYYIFDKASAHYFEDAKLTIQAGVEIRSMNYADKLVIEGSSVLSAIGTATDSIRFKGFADPSTDATSTHGGFILINSANTVDSTVMRFISIDKMGDKDYYTGDQAAIELENGIFVIRNSRIANSEWQGIWGYGDLVKNPVIDNVTFVNNPVPVRVYTDNAGAITNCTNAIINLQGGTFSRASTISKPGPGSFYMLDKASTHYFEGVKLTIQPGVEIHSMNYADKIQMDGAGLLIAKGTEQDSIWFKGFPDASINKSSHGGLILINSTNNTDSSVFAYVGIDKMGDKDYYSGDQAALELEQGRLYITNSSIRNSELQGIFGYGDASKVRVRKTNIFNQPNGAVFNSGKPVFFKCNISNNPTFGINNLSSVTKDTIDARTCWWGDSTGPKQTQTNPNGKGNPVSKKVLYNPWLKWAYQVNDIGAVAVLTPVTGCGLTGAETIKARFTNYGSKTQTGFNVSYRINNGPVITESVGALSLASDSTVDYVFATKADFSTPGATYTLKVFSALGGDTIKVNDTSSATVINRKPNLGKDTTVKICAGSITNITSLYNTASYVQPVSWSVARPDSVGIGTYTLRVTNSFGCTDTAVITVAANPKPNLGKDTTIKICAGTKTSLLKLYDTTGMVTKWSTTTPKNVGTGSYTLIVTNTFGCMDTAAITVGSNPKPNLGKDTTVKICTGSVTSIRHLYDTTGYTLIKYSVTNPDSVGKGTYNLIVTNNKGCTDTAIIKVDSLPSPVKPVISKTGNTTFCLGDSLNLSTNSTGTLQWYRNNAVIKKATTSKYVVKLAGSYKLQLSNAGSCAVFSDSVVATVNQVPKPTITLLNDSLVSSSATGNQWFESGMLLPGVTKQKYSPDNIDVYTVQVTSGGCKSPMSDEFYYTANTFMKIHGLGMQATMYPNPAVNETNLTVTGKGGKVSITITDMAGRTVLKTEGLTNKTLKISTQNLANGIYMVTISDGLHIKTMKLLKGQ